MCHKFWINYIDFSLNYTICFSTVLIGAVGIGIWCIIVDGVVTCVFVGGNDVCVLILMLGVDIDIDIDGDDDVTFSASVGVSGHICWALDWA